MNVLQSLRDLVSPKKEDTTTGNVLSIDSSGAVSVLTGSKVIVCVANTPVRVNDRVRIQGSIILSKIAQATGDIPVFRV